MKISEVSKLVNIPSATLRYYEQIGLLDNIKKEHGIRNYQQQDIEKINFIICMKKAGFSLDSIVQFVNLAKDKKQGEKRRLEILLKQKDILLQEMKEKEETLNFLNYKIDLYTEKVEKQNKKEL
jgi:DNA-binding transcriptional MerR regulator